MSSKTRKLRAMTKLAAAVPASAPDLAQETGRGCKRHPDSWLAISCGRPLQVLTCCAVLYRSFYISIRRPLKASCHQHGILVPI